MDKIRVKLNELPTIRVSLENISVNNVGSVNSHSRLEDRDLEDQHPISAITGLEDALRFAVSEEKISEAVDSALTAAKENGDFDGKDGKTPVKGVDYYTEADKAELKSELSQIEAPKIVSSIAEMTDTSKHYVLDGYIYSNRTVVTPGSKIYPNKFVPSTVTLSSRLSGSSASVTASDGAKGSFVTDFIAVKDVGSVTPYYTRLNWEMPKHDDNKVVFYNSSKSRIGNNTFSITSTGESNYTVSNGETVFDLKNMYPVSTVTPSNWADVAYVRFQLFVKPSGTALVSADYANCKITFDAIYEETEGTTNQEWVNTGITYAPTFKTDLIGVLGEGNVIYLSENLPSGTYTLKYGDETYDTIGTIMVE